MESLNNIVLVLQYIIHVARKYFLNHRLSELKKWAITSEDYIEPLKELSIKIGDQS